MTKQITKLVASVVFLVACSGTPGMAADKANYSGKYSLQERRMASRDKIDSTIDVVQSDDHIEITRVEKGSRTTNRYPLNGSEEAYTSPGGLAGKCKAQLKDKYLVLESEVTSKPSPNAPPMRIHTKERWQLSSDSRILTVKSDVDFPDAPRDASSVVGEAVSGTQKYTRVEKP
jgi:hypothetical protein